MSTDQSLDAQDAHTGSQEALLQALAALLQPLAKLCVAKGLPFQSVEEKLKEEFVMAARAAHPGFPAHRLHSRISAATGLNRREVMRLQAKESESTAPSTNKRSVVTEVFTRWKSDPNFRDKNNNPIPLPRQGAAPSFEALAQSVTRDVHPRSLLEELCRLQLTRVDPETDAVSLLQTGFVPNHDLARMLAFLGENVGEHLQAAVSNVLDIGPKHLEQAIFADELSQVSIEQARTMINAIWQNLLLEVAPRLEELIATDRKAGRVQDQSFRVGLFNFTQTMPVVAVEKT